MNNHWLFGGGAHDGEQDGPGRGEADDEEEEADNEEEENFDSEVVKAKKITSEKKFNKFLREIDHYPSQFAELRSTHMTPTLYRQFGKWTFAGQQALEIKKYKTAEGHISNIKLMVIDRSTVFNADCTSKIEKCYHKILDEVFKLFRKESVDNNVPMINNAVPILKELHG